MKKTFNKASAGNNSKCIAFRFSMPSQERRSKKGEKKAIEKNPKFGFP